MGEHRVVTEYEVKEFCREQGDMVKCIDTSMLNGYGLKSVVCFFNIPFLYMQVCLIHSKNKKIEKNKRKGAKKNYLFTSETEAIYSTAARP